MPTPDPEPGLVISYAYLWHREHKAGREEARKDRPSVIVLAVERASDRAIIVTVLPITHSAPTDPRSAVEVPAPGRDTDRYDYGFLPPRFFNQVVKAFVACHAAGKRRVSPRS